MRYTLLILLSILNSVPSFAARSVEGQDILHRATAMGDTDYAAQLKAQHDALSSIVVECGFPHRDTKILDKKVWFNDQSETMKYYQAEIVISVPIAACEQARNTKDPELKKAILNEALDKAMKDFDILTGLAAKRQEVAEPDPWAEQKRAHEEYARSVELADKNDRIRQLKQQLKLAKADKLLAPASKADKAKCKAEKDEQFQNYRRAMAEAYLAKEAGNIGQFEGMKASANNFKALSDSMNCGE